MKTRRRRRIGCDITVLMNMKSVFTLTKTLKIFPRNSDIRSTISGPEKIEKKVGFLFEEKKRFREMSFYRERTVRI